MQVKIEQRGQKLDNFKEIVKKAIDAKAKAAFRLCSYAYDTNQHYLWGNWPLAAKTNIRGQPMKDPQVEKLKPRSQE